MLRIIRYLKDGCLSILGDYTKPEYGGGIVFIMTMILIILIWNPNDFRANVERVIIFILGMVVLSMSATGRRRRRGFYSLNIFLLILGIILVILGLRS